ncbi:bifunctional diguanylate cyclase/phosphodiesterase [Enterobacter asburiae]|uniref:bifunctional diguanylate cyclase/phosphodiesterase n=1 Tax=Enterobacter asburiae TaxID=61645 RepID=UPI00192C76F5|nr:EAL domain-containing protein [Enterobacter asburiae]MBL5836909.1 EAL domain-containing protein [Enterobacter asburiae]MBL5937468.1 EAL domain-containing protein [Enterobacter asburiae]MBL5962160.1 EAL domain-containing protein [Enterobacter asburiae]MBL5968651.1 EAL domain-containing protein [Enterobacter asburiae]
MTLPLNNPGFTDTEPSKGLINKTFTYIVTLLISIFIAAIISLLIIKDNVNEISDTHDEFLLRKALDTRQESMRSHLKDNAEWGDAYKHLHLNTDVHWAWDKQNLGKSLYDNFGYEGVFVLSPEGSTRYSMVDGKLKLQDLERWLDKSTKDRLLRETSIKSGSPVSVLTLIDSVPAIVSAQWITTGDDSSVQTLPGKPSTMVFIDKLTARKLLTIGQDAGIQNVRTSPATVTSQINNQTEFTLSTQNGDVKIIWDGENPGQALIIYFLPLLILSVVLTVSMTVILMRHIMQKARMLDENTFLLEQARLNLITSEKRFRDVSETTSDWFWETDLSLRITWLSGRFSTITGYENSKWIGRRLDELFPSTSELSHDCARQRDLTERFEFKNCPYTHAQQTTSYCTLLAKFSAQPDGTVVLRGAATDVSQEVEATKRVEFLSRHDELTGLPNRYHIKEFLAGKLAKEDLNHYPFAMICLDLDKFKPVNDIFGHSTGDALLGEVASRLKNCVRRGDFVARQGGDEFMLLLGNTSQQDQIEEVCRRIVQELNRPFAIEGNDVAIGVSMGIALAPRDSSSANDLLRYADIALYQAKQSGRNRWVYYRPDMSEKLTERRKLELELKTAIREEQLYLVYQPRYNLRYSTIDAVEALVRWQHPARGTIMPDQFIPLAEETGLIISLSNWVIRKACAETKDKLPGLSVSVNISAIEFQASDLAERIKEILRETGLEPNRLEIEVTENVTLSDPEKTLQTMKSLKKMGVRILIDDFGTGYASLSYLRKFQFDGLKLDKSFIFTLGDSPQNQSVVEKIIDLGKAYSMAVTAEGVETAEQLSFLKKNKCDEVQGYLLGKPAAITDLNLNANRVNL